jgi:hypothetical protein
VFTSDRTRELNNSETAFALPFTGQTELLRQVFRVVESTGGLRQIVAASRNDGADQRQSTTPRKALRIPAVDRLGRRHRKPLGLILSPGADQRASAMLRLQRRRNASRCRLPVPSWMSDSTDLATTGRTRATFPYRAA